MFPRPSSHGSRSAGFPGKENPPRGAGPGDNRWLQLMSGIVGMVAVANFQYAWTLFVGPLQARHHWTPVQVQDALYLYFVRAETWLVPIEGYLADRFGPRRLLLAGGVLAALSWVLNSFAD